MIYKIKGKGKEILVDMEQCIAMEWTPAEPSWVTIILKNNTTIHYKHVTHKEWKNLSRAWVESHKEEENQ